MVLSPENTEKEDKIKGLERLIDALLVLDEAAKNDIIIDEEYFINLEKAQVNSLLKRYEKRGWKTKYVHASKTYGSSGYIFSAEK